MASEYNAFIFCVSIYEKHVYSSNKKHLHIAWLKIQNWAIFDLSGKALGNSI